MGTNEYMFKGPYGDDPLIHDAGKSPPYIDHMFIDNNYIFGTTGHSINHRNGS